MIMVVHPHLAIVAIILGNLSCPMAHPGRAARAQQKELQLQRSQELIIVDSLDLRECWISVGTAQSYNYIYIYIYVYRGDLLSKDGDQ